MTTNDLNAVSLKSALWDTLQKVRDGKMDVDTANAIAVQSREIIRVVRVQIAVAGAAQKGLTPEIEAFAMPKGL